MHTAVVAERMSSPRSRGCSQAAETAAKRMDVLPALAGLFPKYVFFRSEHVGPPRARGAVPPADLWPTLVALSSPRSRGCSTDRRASRRRPSVLPALAGLFPR
ncbi:hypothetical protein [Alloactinosynnema sp. L-07]|nr:hypothetical protein [Alloactinosynnema sp. L-07]